MFDYIHWSYAEVLEPTLGYESDYTGSDTFILGRRKRSDTLIIDRSTGCETLIQTNEKGATLWS